MAEVVVRISGEEQARYPLGSRMLTLGRSPSCDIVLDYPFISKRHAQIEPEVFVRDLGSSNGVWLDDQPVERLLAEPGRRFSISRHQGVEIEVDFGEAASGPSGARPDATAVGATTAGLKQGSAAEEIARLTEENEALGRQLEKLDTERRTLREERDALKRRVDQLLAPDPEATFVDPPASGSKKKPEQSAPRHSASDPEAMIMDGGDPEATIVDRPEDETAGGDPEATIVDGPADDADSGGDPEATLVDRPEPDDSGGDPEATIVDRPGGVDAGETAAATDRRDEPEATIVDGGERTSGPEGPSAPRDEDLRERRELELRLAARRAEEVRLRAELEKAERLCEALQQDLEQARRSGSAPIGSPDENFVRQLLVALEDADEPSRLSEKGLSRDRLPEDLVFAVSRFYQFGRAVEKVVTRMAQVFRSRLAGDMTMLPGMHTNWRRSLRQLLEKGRATDRQDLDAYLEELRLWVLACLTAYQQGASTWLEELFGRIAPRAIEREIEAAAWRRKLGWDANQYWARYRELMEEYSQDLCIDQLEEAAARVALEMAER